MTACSSGAQSGSLTLPGTVAASGAYLSPIGMTPGKKGKSYLYVDDTGLEAVAVLKTKTWKLVSEITYGIANPNGDWVDNRGNLCVTNSAGYVNEYAHGKFKYSYSSGMVTPVSVTTDSAGNVYEADFSGFVNEYAQGSNTLVASCTTGGEASGVAVDNSGDVFVAYTVLFGDVVEYLGGLGGCSATPLGLTVNTAGGMVLDKRNNIVICDASAGTVDISEPPYKGISKTLDSGLGEPTQITINQKNDQAYVVDAGAFSVDVLKYPSGKVITQLGTGNGLKVPSGAVASSNYNP